MNITVLGGSSQFLQAGLSTIECANLLVIDVALTHYALMLLTSAGLYVSDTVSGQLVRFHCKFQM